MDTFYLEQISRSSPDSKFVYFRFTAQQKSSVPMREIYLATRIWVEDSNGVSFYKHRDLPVPKVNMEEFFEIKLRSQSIEKSPRYR